MYRVVGDKHNEKIVNTTYKKIFFPQSTILYSLLSFSEVHTYLTEWDINECLSYQEKPGNWLFEQSYILLNKSHNLVSYLNFDLCFPNL